MKYVIKNGRIINPKDKIDEVIDILISDGKIKKIGKNLDIKSAKIIDAKNKIVTPGLIDMHTHLREPGREDKETIRTGTRAAVCGGFTSVCCMPNTKPALDNSNVINDLEKIIKKDALCNTFIIGAITKDRQGEKLIKFKKEEVVALSDDGASVENKELMKKALKEAKKENILIIEHCEDKRLSEKGVVNKGFISTKIGVCGISNESEYKRVKRNLDLAEETSSRIHIAHVSCKESVELIRNAKKKGVNVTAETAPHYFALTDEDCTSYNTNMKVNPPLRAKEDKNAIIKALKDGTIDVIATDHAPHTDSEKDVEFDHAPFGMIGLETALSICIKELIDTKVLTWTELINKLSLNPAKILNIKRGTLSEGQEADITIIDPESKWVYEKERIQSKSSNSPFLNWKLKGFATCVIVGGKVILKDRKLQCS